MAYRSSRSVKKNTKLSVKNEALDDKIFDKKEKIVEEKERSDKDEIENNDDTNKKREMEVDKVINDKIGDEIKISKREDSKQLVEILRTKEEHEREVQFEILQKSIPTYTPNESILRKLEDIKRDPIKGKDKLFRLFEPRQLPIYRANGEKELRNRWYWMLKDDNLPTGDYDVREWSLKLYEYLLDNMPDYVLLKDMAVENRNSRDAGKVVDSETADICDKVFQDEETEGIVRRYIADMRQRVNAERNAVEYPAVLHPIDAELNEYFLNHQIVQQFDRRVLFNYIPERIRNDPNYNFNLDNSFLHNSRYIPPLLQQDRLRLHDNFESLWDTLTKANYVLARSVVPDLKELVSTESQIQKMSQDLQLEALTIQSETQFLTGINSQAANDAFKTIIAAMLSQRLITAKFSPSNYMSLISATWLLSVVPTSLFLRESLIALQLAIVNTLIYPAFGMPKMHYMNGEPRTPFEIAEAQIQNFEVRNWLHFVNHNQFAPVVIDGVLNQVLNDHVRYGRVIDLLINALNVLSRQNFQSYPLDYKRSVQRGINLLANRTGQLIDLTRLLCYNYQTLMACITMNMQRVQTITTEELQLTSVTSLAMLIGNATVIPEPQTLFHYYETNVKFHTNYNEKINDTVAIIHASRVFNLYKKKIKSIVEEFLKKLHIFDTARIPDDQMYMVRNRLRDLPMERRRLDIFNIVQNNRRHIERASNKIAQGVIIAYQEMPLEHDELYGYVNLARDVNGYQQINLEELVNSGDYGQITHMLLNNQPVALVGAIAYKTETSAVSLIAKMDATEFAKIVKQRKVDDVMPIMYKINSDSSDYYLVVNYNWQPTSTTRVYKQVPQLFDFRRSVHMLRSNLTYSIFTNILSFISATTVEPINAISTDGQKIMNEL
nr:VP2 [Rotavirus A]